MKLTVHSDYSLRALIYLGTHPDRPVSVAEISRAYDISQNHVAKVAHQLTRAGFTRAKRGKTGGLLLARPPEDISIGAVLRVTEPDFDLLECFRPETDSCRISSRCALKGILYEARAAFFAVLNAHSLASLIQEPEGLKPLFKSPTGS